MRFINSTLHGLLDYAAAVTLIIAPFVLGLAEQSAFAHWFSVAAGTGLTVYSLMTQYAYSLAKIIPFKTHLMLDLAAAVVFLLAPFLFGFEGIVAGYYWVMGAGVVMVVLFSNALEHNARLASNPSH
ncbi:MAG: SPW repeat domain-containing protein [Leucothrix sp.]